MNAAIYFVSIGLSASLFFLFKLIEHEGFLTATELCLITIMCWLLNDKQRR
jgi:hypothetical protein